MKVMLEQNNMRSHITKCRLMKTRSRNMRFKSGILGQMLEVLDQKCDVKD